VHTARKLMLLVSMAMAAMAFAVPSASGQTLEATSETTGEHCSAVTVVGHTPEGGCPIHAMSEGGVIIRMHVFGIESTVTTCDEEIHGVSDGDTNGYGFSQVISGNGCGREPCEEPDGSQEVWPAQGNEGSTHAGFDASARVSICVATTPDMNETRCSADIPWRETGEESHQFEGGESSEMPGIGTAGNRCEVIGHWLTESPDTDLELSHL